MSSSLSMKTVLVTGSILSLASQALGHMELSWPYPLHSKYNPANNYQNIDYSMTSPLAADGSNFPCKGYQNDRPISSVITYDAGSTYNITLAGSATHGGGSCQLSLSYDNGATFRVIKSIIGGCPLTSTYDFTLPSYVPNGEALFGWSWQNEQGNREFYMNCAEVTIQGSSASSKRDTSSSFESLPFIWKANLKGINDCVTVEGSDTVYPEPGPQVQYGGSMSSSSPASSNPGVCDAATPFGQTYKYLSDTSEPQTGNAGSGAAAATTVKSSSTKAAASTKASSASSKAASSAAIIKSSSTGVASSSKMVTLSTVNAGKPASPSSAAGVPTPSTISSAAAASTGSPDDDGDDGDDGGECADVTLTVYSGKGATSTSVIRSGTTSAAAAASTSTSSVIDSEYATGNLTTYLPCVPGTYICTSATAWVTCDQTMYSDGSTAWVYEESRSLGNGAVCVPSFSPYTSSNKAYAQQADAPSGYYRDDRIAYSTGQSCSDDGAIQCVGSSEFDMCADAYWYQMGGVASGTSCSKGALIVS